MPGLGPFYDLRTVIEDVAHIKGQVAQDMGLESPCYKAMRRAYEELMQARRLYDAP